MKLRTNVVSHKWLVRYSWGKKSENHFSDITVFAESVETAMQKAEECLKLRFDTPAMFDICDITLLPDKEVR